MLASVVSKCCITVITAITVIHPASLLLVVTKSCEICNANMLLLNLLLFSLLLFYCYYSYLV